MYELYTKEKVNGVTYMKPHGLNHLLMRLAEWIVDYRIRKANPYGWSNNQYWKFVNDVAGKVVEEQRRLSK